MAEAQVQQPVVVENAIVKNAVVENLTVTGGRNPFDGTKALVIFVMCLVVCVVAGLVASVG